MALGVVCLFLSLLSQQHQDWQPGLHPSSVLTVCRPILQIPMSYGPVAIYAKVTPEFHKSSTLQLSAPVAAAIFQGNITTWDDPAILALNPNLT